MTMGTIHARTFLPLLLLLLVTHPQRGFAEVGSRAILDANVATEEQLARLEGLDAQVVKAILEHRPFASVLELDTLLTQQKLARAQLMELYRDLFVHVNLNDALRGEILLIPGVGRRMAHEFEEYRPYTGGLRQFRREIGKYVDSTEVARLERYVFVPINLNTATDQEILSIPGVGRRMLHEFKEYRPYVTIQQFRHEIGKYVDAREVVRLERYLTLK